MNALVKLCLAALAFVPRHSCALHVPTYEWIDDVAGISVTCDRCPPGTRVVTHCSKNRPTECGACPDLHYTEFWNYLERCRYCNVFCAENQFEKSPCNATHNRVCECKSGYYAEDGFCRRHSTCPPGQGVSRNGTAHDNVKCAPCEEGYYSSEHSSTNPCLKHSVCKAGEREIPGNEKMDTFCTLCHASSSSADQDVCGRAVIDYVSQYPLHTRKHKRLENTVRKMAHEKNKNVPLKHMLLTIKRNHKDQPFVHVMLDILKRSNLLYLECKVKTWFLGGLGECCLRSQ